MPRCKDPLDPVAKAVLAAATSMPSSLTPDPHAEQSTTTSRLVSKADSWAALGLATALSKAATAGAASSDLVDVNELASQIARNSAAQQVAAISASTRKQLARIISDGLDKGWSDAQIKQRITDVIGLDPRSEQAVVNLRDHLTQQNKSQPFIDRQTQAYSKRLLARRAQVIAANETHKVLQQAQQAIWAQKQQVGELSPYAVRVYRTHKDERTCPVCRPLNGRRFSLQDTTNLPPLHPNCRCTSDLVDEGVAKTDPGLIYKGAVVRHVRDAEYWGLPIGTPIHPGMKPKGPNAKKRIGFVPDPERRRQALITAESVFEAVKPHAKREFPSDYQDAAMKRFVNKQVASHLLLNTEGNIEFWHWLEYHTNGDRGPFLLRKWKDDYASKIRGDNKRLVYQRQIESLTNELADQQNAAKQNDGYLKTYYEQEAKNTEGMLKDAQDALAALPSADTPVDYHSEDFRQFVLDDASRKGLDFHGENFIELDHLTAEEFASAMAYRETVAKWVRTTVDNWASTSLDHDDEALALQYAVNRKWNTPGWDKVLDYVADRFETDTSEEAHLERRDHWERRITDEYGENKPYYDAIAQSIYDVTQDRLQQEGVHELTLFRGMQFTEDELSALPDDLFDENKGAVMNFNPLSSWSYNENVATENFAQGNGGTTFRITVPADRVFSSAVMGLGCLNEQEYVVLGDDYHVVAKSPHRERLKMKAAGYVWNGWEGKWEKPVASVSDDEQEKTTKSYADFIQKPDTTVPDLHAVKSDIAQALLKGKISQQQESMLQSLVKVTIQSKMKKKVAAKKTAKKAVAAKPVTDKELTDLLEPVTDFGHLTDEDSKMETYISMMETADSWADLNNVWQEVQNHDWYVENDAKLYDTFKKMKKLLAPPMKKAVAGKKPAKKALPSSSMYLLKISNASTPEMLEHIRGQIENSLALNLMAKKTLLASVEEKMHQIKAKENK